MRVGKLSQRVEQIFRLVLAIKEMGSPSQALVHCWLPSLNFPPLPLTTGATKSLKWDRISWKMSHPTI